MLHPSNQAINNIHHHFSRMMGLSSKYGKKMGNMGTINSRTAEGAHFARTTAKTMMNPNMEAGDINNMLGMIRNKAVKAGMSERHMGTMDTLSDRIRMEAFGTDYMRDIKKTPFNSNKTEMMRQGNRLGLL